MKKILISLLIGVIVISYSLLARRQNLSTLTLKSNQNLKTSTINSPSTNSPVTVNHSSGYQNHSLSQQASTFNNGTYNGQVVNAYWGNVQVQAVINNQRLAQIDVLNYPNSHATSVYINQQALPILKSEALKKQSSKVQIISGATFSSEAFIQSLASALSEARK